MELRIKGSPINVDKSIVAKVSHSSISDNQNTALIVGEIVETSFRDNVKCLLTSNEDIAKKIPLPGVFYKEGFNHLSEGDVVVINPDGNVNTLYRVNANHNTLFATERCNSNCLMCSQPPKNRDDVSRLYEINKQLIPLIPKNCHELGISGGEPTLMGKYFFEMLDQIKNELPDTEIHILTNGRSFAWVEMAEKLANIGSNRIMLGIPLYSDYYSQHDYIVQAKDAFFQTVQGIYNLARLNQRIEIRVVLHKQTIPRLTKLARFIYKTFPFVEHVTFMGLEYIGYTPHNIEKLWIDPVDYIKDLEEAVQFLDSQGMCVSIYNSQLCVLPESLWKFSKKSISDWKNSYLPECSRCAKLEECGGLFTWNLKKYSRAIKPF